MSFGNNTLPRDFEGLWTRALERYKDETGHELPPADDFPSDPRDPGEVIGYVDRQGQAFNTFRAKGDKIRRALKPMVDILLPFLDASAEGASVRITLVCPE